jgi:hypothetical protein
LPRDRSAAHREVDDLGDGEDPHQHRYQVKPLPQKDEPEVEPQATRLTLLPDRAEEESEHAHGEALDLRARIQAAERGDAGDSHHRDHEKLRRAERQDQGPDDGDGDRERSGSDERAEERAHQGRAQRAARFAALRHRVSVDHGGGRQSFAGHAEKYRSDVPGRGRDRMHPEQESEGLRRRHRENERQHEGERRRTADPRQQADDEAEAHPHEHQAEGFPLEDEKQAADQGIEHRSTADFVENKGKAESVAACRSELFERFRLAQGLSIQQRRGGGRRRLERRSVRSRPRADGGAYRFVAGHRRVVPEPEPTHQTSSRRPCSAIV